MNNKKIKKINILIIVLSFLVGFMIIGVIKPNIFIDNISIKKLSADMVRMGYAIWAGLITLVILWLKFVKIKKLKDESNEKDI